MRKGRRGFTQNWSSLDRKRVPPHFGVRELSSSTSWASIPTGLSTQDTWPLADDHALPARDPGTRGSGGHGRPMPEGRGRLAAKQSWEPSPTGRPAGPEHLRRQTPPGSATASGGTLGRRRRGQADRSVRAEDSPRGTHRTTRLRSHPRGGRGGCAGIGTCQPRRCHTSPSRGSFSGRLWDVEEPLTWGTTFPKPASAKGTPTAN